MPKWLKSLTRVAQWKPQVAVHRRRPVRGRYRGEELTAVIAQLQAEGDWTVAALAKYLNVGERIVKLHRAKIRDGWEPKFRTVAKLPKAPSEIPEAARATVQNTPEAFKAFIDRYWPDEPMPEHVYRAVRMCFHYPKEPQAPSCPPNCEGGHWKLRVIETWPPEHAKSRTFSIRWPVWRLCQDRVIGEGFYQGLLVSETDTLAQQWAGAVAWELEWNTPLVEDFGAFRTDRPECRWSPGKGFFRVTGSRVTSGFSILSRGRGSQIPGLRAKDVIADDVLDPNAATKEEERAKTKWWWDNQVEPRVARGGVIRDIGTRVHIHDLHWELAQQTDYFGNPVFENHNFPALRDPETGDPSLNEDALPLWPDRWPREVLLREKYKGQRQFGMTYQGDPKAEGAGLGPLKWIYGEDGDENPDKGCLDRLRDVGAQELPDGYARVVSYDPSGGARYAALIVADVKADRNDFRCVILEIIRKKIGVTEVIKELRRIGENYRPTHFIAEKNIHNSVQDIFRSGFVVDGQVTSFDIWRKQFGIKAVKHQTGDNKNNRQYGRESLGTDFEFGNIRLPFRTADAKEQSNWLINEYNDPSDTDDVLDALWFIKFNHRDLWLAKREPNPNAKGWDVPKWLAKESWTR